MATTHKIRTQYPLPGTDDGVEVEITFGFTKGSPAILYGTPQPADPDEIEVRSVKVVDEEIIPAFLQEAIEQWADEWIVGDGLPDAMAEVTDTMEAAREFAAELRADR